MVFYLFPGFQQGYVRFIRNLDASFCQQCCDRMIVTIAFHIKGGSQRFYLQIIAADDKTLRASNVVPSTSISMRFMSTTKGCDVLRATSK